MDSRKSLGGRPRRRITGLAIAAFGLSLGACASTEPAATVAAASSPAPIPGHDWFLHTDGDQASLAYGQKDSDDLRLGLECSRGAGRVELNAVADTGVREIRLESGGDTESFAADGEPSQIHDGDYLTARTKTDSPVFHRFRRVGWLTQWQGERREIYVAHAASLADIERFFTFCS